MSCIHLHLGQAGNQIGKTFWSLAEEEYVTSPDGAAVAQGAIKGMRRGRASKSALRMHSGAGGMFHEDGYARCLAVDSEPKVVQSFKGQVRSLRPENTLHSQSGLANNWAMGFASCHDDEGGGGLGGEQRNLFSRCMEGIRKEAERCCWLNSVVMNHSLAGGTGSGFGSGLLQALRDEYPSLYLISVCVGAFRAGESPLQHYNSTLALHHLEAFADAVIYRGNDDLLHDPGATLVSQSRGTAASLGKGQGIGFEYGRRPGAAPTTSPVVMGRNGRREVGTVRQGASQGVSIADINQSLALDMASYFFPTTKLLPTATTEDVSCSDQDVPAARNFDGGSLMAAACPLPGAKFVDLRSTLSSSVHQREGGGTSLASLLSSNCSDWVGYAASLGKTHPLCPQKGGGHSEDACVAAHHLFRGVKLASSRTINTTENRTGTKSVDKVRSRKGHGDSLPADVLNGAPSATALAEACTELRKHHGCVEWRTGTDVSYLPALRRGEVARSVTTVCNQTRIRRVLDDIVSQAEEKFEAGAYLHWYYRHGLEDEDFLAAFEGIRSVQKGYDGLAKALGGGTESSGYGYRRR